jgi:hypothetical protein
METSRTPRCHANVIQPGHDVWVVATRAVVGFEVDSRADEEYAKG